MIKVIFDTESVTVDTVADLEPYLDKMFVADPRDNVMVTYTINTQPTSRRIIAPSESESESE